MRWKRRKKEMPSGLWLQCPNCKKPIFRQEMEKRLRVCPECSYHFPLNSRERIAHILDADSFEEAAVDLEPTDRLEFVDTKPYAKRLAAAQEKTGLKDAAVVGTGRIKGMDVALAILDFSFIGGSMGWVVGEKITIGAELALERGIPLIAFSGSGGARMMEGAISLMQMAKTCTGLARLDDSKGLFISVLTNPTTGGVTASYASMGDVTLAEPGALIGFAGPRVIKTTIKQELPEGFQTSEFMLEHGFVDRIVSRSELRNELSKLVSFFTNQEPQEEVRSARPRDDEGEEEGTGADASGEAGEPAAAGKASKKGADAKKGSGGDKKDKKKEKEKA